MFDGKAFAGEIIEAVKAHVAKALAPVLSRIETLEAMPQPESGKDADPELVAQLVAETVGCVLAGWERPANGIDGKDGAPGVDGKDGEKGERGRDGVGIAGAMIGRDGQLLVTLSNGDMLDLGQVNGHDGLGFDDLEVTYDGDRAFTFKFSQGDRVKEFPFRLPVMIYRGVYRDGERYHRGDTVTFGGSLWHCDATTEDKPDDALESWWTKAVRRGRDGKNGKDGERGIAGPQGRAGRDLTQMAQDGSKW